MGAAPVAFWRVISDNPIRFGHVGLEPLAPPRHSMIERSITERAACAARGAVVLPVLRTSPRGGQMGPASAVVRAIAGTGL